jgi:sugar phosphate isomerase/epimerase
MQYKLAFSSLGCPQYTVDQIIEAARTYGYAGVSLRTVRGESLLPSLEEFSGSSLSATAAKFRNAGVEVLCVSSGVRFTAANAEEREKELATAGAYADIAAALGSPYIRIFGGPYPEDQDKSVVYGHVVEGFQKACDMAASRGVSVLLETHDSFSRGETAKELVRSVGKDNLFIVWDILHSLRFGETFADTWRHAGPFIRHVHIKDSLEFGPDGFDLKLLGRGRVQISEAVQLLIDQGYSGFLEFEWEKGWHPDIPGPEIAFPHGAGFLEGLLTGLQGNES